MREYLYIGAKLVAEYQPQPEPGKYYYCTTYQINSICIVTDDQGNMVYAAAQDPYGGVQQTWAKAFEPECKFIGIGDGLNFKFHLNFWIDSSDKDQGGESGLCYFGARYYEPTLYRFLTPDPMIPTDDALYNPQRWNLYGYCLGNPINYLDKNGKYGSYVHFNLTYSIALIYLSPQVAFRIAMADADVDRNFKTCSWFPWGYKYHFPNPWQLEDALDIAFSTLYPEELGRAIHTIRDFFCHILQGYSSNYSSFGHFLETVANWTLNKIFPGTFQDPDDPLASFDDIERMSYMVEITAEILEDYARRLNEFITYLTIVVMPLIAFAI